MGTAGGRGVGTAGRGDEVQGRGEAGMQTCRAPVRTLLFFRAKQELPEGSEQGSDATGLLFA